MKAKERLDKILEACRTRMQEEVTALLGKEFKLGSGSSAVVSKEAFFEEAGGKLVAAKVQLEGELEGEGCLIVSVRDAIRIGGTLIMLPDAELESSIGEENYSEEIKDSYGEIANILCGSLTSTFEEQHSKSFRLVRKEQEVVQPNKVSTESDDPVSDGTYYAFSAAMQLGSHSLGKLHLLLPGVPFGMVEEKEAEASTDAQPASTDSGPQGGAGDSETAAGETAATAAAPDAGEASPTVASTKPVLSGKELDKQKKQVNKLLDSCMSRLGSEVGALLGDELKAKVLGHQLMSKEDLLEDLVGKQAMARLDIRGDATGETFLFVGIKDAIYLGGSLIMLPEAELEATVLAEDFGADAQDAYGEIANIIAGVYTAVFEEQYRKNLGFVKTTLEEVQPAKVDPQSDEVLPCTHYYVSTGSMAINDKALGNIVLAIPADVLELEGLIPGVEPESAIADAAAETAAKTAATGGAAGQGAGSSPTGAAGDAAAADILIFTDDDTEAASLGSGLRELGFTPKVLHFRDSVQSNLNPGIRMVFLVMGEVNERGFGVAIKISSAGYAKPLVAAGPAWTRTLVLKAVKYGATDILITPASKADIQEKIELNLSEVAA